MKRILVFVSLLLITIVVMNQREVNAVEIPLEDPSVQPRLNDFENANINVNRQHVFVVTEEYEVYYKDVALSSQLTEIDTSLVPLASGEYFVDFTGGYEVYIGLTNQGRIFTWGTYLYGGIGNGMYGFEYVEPSAGHGGFPPDPFDYYVEPQNAIIFTGQYEKIYGNNHQFMALDINSRLIIWGDASLRGRITYEEDIAASPITLLDATNLNQNETIKDVYTGYNVVMVHTTEERLLSFGAFDTGSLGDGRYRLNSEQDTIVNPLEGDPIVDINLGLQPGDVITDVYIGKATTAIINNTDLYVWGNIGYIADEDLVNDNLANVQYIEDEIKDTNRLFVFPTFVPTPSLTGDIRAFGFSEPSQNHSIIVFSDSDYKIINNHGRNFDFDLFNSSIDWDNVQYTKENFVYSKSNHPGFFQYVSGIEYDVSTTYISYYFDNIVNNELLPYRLKVEIPSIINPTGDEYTFKIVVRELDTLDLVVFTDAYDDLTELYINEDNTGLTFLKPLQEDTEYLVDIFLYYEEFTVGPFPFYSEVISTMPPLGNPSVTIDPIGDSVEFEYFDSTYTGYALNINFDQTFYKYSDHKSNLAISLWEVLDESSCSTTYLDGYCQVDGKNNITDEVGMVTDSKYSHTNDMFNTTDVVKGWEQTSGFGVDQYSTLYITNLDENTDYYIKFEFGSSNLFGDLIDPLDPSLGKDGFIAMYPLPDTFTTRSTPTVTVGTIVESSNSFEIPIIGVSDVDNAILNGNIYTEVCSNVDDDCDVIIDNITESSINIDNLLVGGYTVRSYYLQNLQDNSGVQEIELLNETMSILKQKPTYTYEANLSGTTYTISNGILDDPHEAIVGSELFIELCLDTCEVKSYTEFQEIIITDLLYEEYIVNIYANIDLEDGLGTVRYDIETFTLSLLKEIPNVTINTPSVTDDTITIEITDVTDITDSIVNSMIHVELCADSNCTDYSVSTTNSSIIIEDIPYDEYDIHVYVIYDINDGSGNTELTIYESAINVIADHPIVIIDNVRVVESDLIITYSSPNGFSAITDEEITFELCTDSCIEYVASTNDSSLIITDIPYGEYTITLFGNVNVGTGEVLYELVINHLFGYSKESPTLSYGDITVIDNVITIPRISYEDLDGAIENNTVSIELCVVESCNVMNFSTEDEQIIIDSLKPGNYDVRILINVDLFDMNTTETLIATYNFDIEKSNNSTMLIVAITIPSVVAVGFVLKKFIL